MLVESVSKGPWNECPSQRGIAVQVFVDWVSKCAWNPQFRVYSRYVPNLTRRDGSAFDNLIKANLQG